MPERKAFCNFVKVCRKSYNAKGECDQKMIDTFLAMEAIDCTHESYDKTLGVNWEVLWCQRKCPGSVIRNGKLYFLLTAEQLYDFIVEMRELGWPH